MQLFAWLLRVKQTDGRIPTENKMNGRVRCTVDKETLQLMPNKQLPNVNTLEEPQ